MLGSKIFRRYVPIVQCHGTETVPFTQRKVDDGASVSRLRKILKLENYQNVAVGIQLTDIVRVRGVFGVQVSLKWCESGGTLYSVQITVK
jgi:hypothetical protein